MSDWTFSEPKETKKFRTNVGVAYDALFCIFEYVVVAKKAMPGGGEHCKFGYGHTPEEALLSAYKKVTA